MALKGNLRDFSTTQLFNLISLARKTGTLTVENDQQARISFREGKLIYAAMGARDASLAQMLNQAGKLSSEQSRIIDANAGSKGDKELGHLLIQAGHVSQGDIITSVRQHMLDVVYKLFTWAEGIFRFDANQLPAANRITIPVDLDNVIMEGSRRLKEWARLQEELPDLNVSLQFTNRRDTRLGNISLTVEEWRVISLVNPRNTMRQIARANSLSEFEIRRIVFGLLQAGIVEPVQAPAQRPERPSGQENGTPGRTRPEPVQPSPSEKRSIVTRLIQRIRRL
jgi:hypothetical protein